MKVFLTSRAFLILSLLWLSNISVFGFFQDSPARVKTKYEFTDARISQADTLLKKRQYEEALDAYQKAYDIYESESFYEGMVYAKERMGRAYSRIKEDSLSQGSLEQALRISVQNLKDNHLLKARLYLERGLQNYRKRDFENSASYLDSSSKVYSGSENYDSALFQSIVQYKYYTYFFSNKSNDTLIKYLDERKKLFEFGKGSIANEIFLLSDYASTYSRTGNFQRAAAYALEAVRICEENSETIDPYYYSDALFNLGRALNSQKEFPRALNVARKLVSSVEARKGQPRDYLAYLNLLAVVFNNLKKYDSAAMVFKNIITELEIKGSSGTRFYRNSVMNLGVCYQLMGSDSLARLYLVKSLEEEKRAIGISSSTISPNYKYLGQYYTGISSYENGLMYYDSALRVKLMDESYDILDYPSEGSFEVTYDALNLLKNKQESFVNLFKSDAEDSTKLLKKAIDYTENTHQHLMARRKDLEASQGKLFLSENFKSLYEVGLEAIYLIRPQTNEYFREAFNFLGYSKSMMFLEQAGELNGVQDKRLSEELRNNYYAVKTEVDQLEAEFSKYIDFVTTSDTLRDINSRLINANVRLEKVKESIAKALNGEKEDKSEVFGQNQFSEVLEYLEKNPKTALLEYFVGDDYIYVLAVSKKQRIFKRVEHNIELKTSLTNFFRIISERPSIESYNESLMQFNTSAQVLYNNLLDPILSEVDNEINKLKIIPDEQLSQLPFEALVRSNKQGIESFKDLDYLINHSVSYALSSKQVGLVESKPKAKKQLLGIGYSGGSSSSSGQRSSNFGALPGTEEEIRFLESKIEGEYLFGNEGNKETFLKIAKDFDVLHLAIHGEANNSDRYQSSLIFSGSEDNSLKTNDLYLAGLNARLAILSACESGLGQINKGEGTFSIARGFSLVGVPSVVMSLWKVNDKISSKLMVDLHTNLSYGLSVDEALSGVKRDYLSNSDQYTSHPYYWSAFVSLGEEVKIDSKRDLSFLFIVIALSLFLVYGLLKRKGAK